MKPATPMNSSKALWTAVDGSVPPMFGVNASINGVRNYYPGTCGAPRKLVHT